MRPDLPVDDGRDRRCRRPACSRAESRRGRSAGGRAGGSVARSPAATSCQPGAIDVINGLEEAAPPIHLLASARPPARPGGRAPAGRARCIEAITRMALRSRQRRSSVSSAPSRVEERLQRRTLDDRTSRRAAESLGGSPPSSHSTSGTGTAVSFRARSRRGLAEHVAIEGRRNSGRRDLHHDGTPVTHASRVGEARGASGQPTDVVAPRSGQALLKLLR